MQKAIEKRVDSLLNQSPKALAAMASQITDDVLKSIMEGSTEEDAMKALTEFMHKYIKPMDARTYHIYRDEYSLLREHYWMNMLFKSWKEHAELRRDYLIMIKATITCVHAVDCTREYAGLPVSDRNDKFDVDELLNQTTEAIEDAELLVTEWGKPDIWHLIGYEPPVTDA